MRFRRWIEIAIMLAASAMVLAQTVAAQTADSPLAGDAELQEKSREAGLLTDWHLDGRFVHQGKDEFAREYAPEKAAAKRGAQRGFEPGRYELLFSDGTFALPTELARLTGVFYANSSTYLTSGGDWNVYVESGAEAVVFVDGKRAVTRGPKAAGVRRGRIHVESGYHSVMVKFKAQAAPFRIAILPLNSGSRRKNNTPYLQASPAQEDMLSEVRSGRAPKAQAGN